MSETGEVLVGATVALVRGRDERIARLEAALRAAEPILDAVLDADETFFFTKWQDEAICVFCGGLRTEPHGKYCAVLRAQQLKADIAALKEQG